MISIYTHTNNPLKKEFWKHIAKKVLRKYSGPDAVLDSLVRGLKKSNVPYEVNPLIAKYKITHVLSGIEVLKEKISHKKSNQVLIVGPTVITTTDDYDNIIANDAVDIILTPSDWVKDFYSSTCVKIRNKIHSWPAGVPIPKQSSNHSGDIILFKKDIADEVFSKVKETLEKYFKNYKVLEYGKFSHAQYLDLLKTAPFMIYLQKTESQGIALQEAWSYDVPTLVYKNSIWSMGKYEWTDEKIAAPYLDSRAGAFFTLDDIDDIISKLNVSEFNAKAYCEEGLSDSKSTAKLINIIKKHHEKSY